MHIEINDKTRLSEIQDVFSEFYPYLSLSFFHKAHKLYEASDQSDVIDPSTTIGKIKKTHVSGLLEMLPLNTVADVEREFLDRFGLSVQVLWKEKDSWQQTTGMDSFTLKEVNEMGRSSSDEYIVSDYEEGFEDIDDKPELL